MKCIAREIIDNFRAIYGMLEDEESRDTYLHRLNYLVTGDKRCMDQIVEKYLPQLPMWVDESMDRLSETIPEGVPVILYGAGVDADRCLPSFRKCSGFAGLCDRDPEKQKNGFRNCRVMSPEELLEKYRNAVVVISTSFYANEIAHFLAENAFPEKQVIRMSSSDGRDRPDRELPEVYFGMDFLSFGDHEIFVDGGCCDLGSTRLFMKHCKHVDKVFAFEPDPANFARCEAIKRDQNLSQVELLPFGTWSRDTKVSFIAAGSDGSHIVDVGGTSVRVTSIDKVVGSAPVTFIKLDVEGAEMESLKGAQKTIRRNRPQLAVCIYHKPEDMIEIPLYIKSLVPDYRLYVRHLGNAPWGTVLYAV